MKKIIDSMKKLSNCKDIDEVLEKVKKYDDLNGRKEVILSDLRKINENIMIIEEDISLMEDNLKKKLSIMGVMRIFYYIIAATILLSCWYFIKNAKGESLLTSILDSGGTVLLWEVMTLIFIEGKNFKYKVRINKKLSNMNIVFKYIDDINN